MEAVFTFAIIFALVCYICSKRRERKLKRIAAQAEKVANFGSANADEIMVAFLGSFRDGSSALHSALPDELLISYYTDILAKVEKAGRTDPVQFASTLSEMLLLQMEITTRFTRRVYSDRHP